MEEMEYMEEFDTVSNMRSIMFKLPYKLRERWRNRAYEMHEERIRRVRILDIVSFVEKQARVAADPVFGDLQDPLTVKGKMSVKSRYVVKSQMSKSAGSSFATDVTVASKEKKLEPFCPFCSCKHTLELCKQFMETTHRDKLNFLKTKGTCFGCLCSSHISRDCKKRLTCTVFKLSHPSVLHINSQDRKVKEREKSSGATQGAPVESCGHIWARELENVLSIVPVRVKSAKGSQVLEVYALMDPGCTATFCSEALMS